jgi:hypothetical protein
MVSGFHSITTAIAIENFWFCILVQNPIFLKSLCADTLAWLATPQFDREILDKLIPLVPRKYKSKSPLKGDLAGQGNCEV